MQLRSLNAAQAQLRRDRINAANYNNEVFATCIDDVNEQAIYS